MRIAYVDSLTAPGYALAGHPRYPGIVDDYRGTFATVSRLACDLLLTPHPEASGWTFADGEARRSRPMTCAEYAEAAEAQLARQLETKS